MLVALKHKRQTIPLFNRKTVQKQRFLQSRHIKRQNKVNNEEISRPSTHKKTLLQRNGHHLAVLLFVQLFYGTSHRQKNLMILTTKFCYGIHWIFLTIFWELMIDSEYIVYQKFTDDIKLSNSVFSVAQIAWSLFFQSP